MPRPPSWYLQATSSSGGLAPICPIQPFRSELVGAAAHDVGVTVTVRSAVDGWEGLIACAPLRPRLLFLDIMLPGIDGLEVAQRLPSIDGLAELTVVFVTASQSNDVLTRAEAIGNEVLAKPLRPDDLAAVMSDVLESAAS